MIGAVLIVAGVVVCGIGAVKLRPAYRFARYPLEDIGPLERARTNGTVALEGTAQPVDGTASTEISERPCLAYEHEVEEPGEGLSGWKETWYGQWKRRWETVNTDAGGTTFRLEDSTGSVLVDPSDADLFLSTGRQIEPKVEGKFRYQERILRPDRRAYVLGQPHYDDTTEAGSEVGTVTIRDGDQGPPLVISDQGTDAIVRELVKAQWRWLVGGIALCCAGVVLLALSV